MNNIIWYFIDNIFCYFIPLLITIILYSVISFIFSPIIYALHYCIIGLIIGCSISYGLKENKYSNKRNLLIFIFLCSITSGIYNLDYNFLYLFTKSINTFFLYIVCLGIGGFIFYRKNSYIYLILTGTSMVVYLIIYIIYKPLTETGLRLQQMYLIFFFFFSIILIEFVLYILRQKVTLNKKAIFILIFISFIIIHLVSSFFYYILVPDRFFTDNYWAFLLNPLENIHCREICFFPEHLWKNYNKIKYIYEIITFHKINSDNLGIIIGIHIWIAEFLITVFSAWTFVLYTCPCLATSNNNNIKEKT